MGFVDELKIKIDAEKKELTKTYAKLGEKYFELHSDDAETQLMALVGEAKKSKSAVENYEAQISQIENKDRCPKCGAAVPEGFFFCGVCGAKVRDAQATAATPAPAPAPAPIPTPAPAKPAAAPAAVSAGKVCPKCGAENEPDAFFCEECGTRLDSKPEPVKTTVTCPKCKAELEPDSVFCTECGTKLK